MGGAWKLMEYFQAGELKALGLVGAYEVLEANGFSFKRLAGTSAGAIIAAFIAAGYTSKEILKIMEETDKGVSRSSNDFASISNC